MKVKCNSCQIEFNTKKRGSVVFWRDQRFHLCGRSDCDQKIISKISKILHIERVPVPKN